MHKNNIAPNFKVKHPYSNLINSIILGIILFLSSVLAVGFNVFNISSVSSLTGLGTFSNPYVVQTEDDLESSTIKNALAQSGKYIALGADIYYSQNKVIVETLRANLNGNGYSFVSNSAFTNNNYGEITNTKFAYTTTGTYEVPSKVVAYNNYGKLNNLEILSTSETKLVSAYPFGSFASVNYGEIVQVINRQSFKNLRVGATTGGVVALNYGVIDQAVNYGNVENVSAYTINSKQQYTGAVGGIVGENYFHGAYINAIVNSYNMGSVTAGAGAESVVIYDGGHAGGIVGAFNFSGVYGVQITDNSVKNKYKTYLPNDYVLNNYYYVINNTLNFGTITAGAGSNGLSGLGGEKGAKGGYGGNGGGAGGNAGGIVGLSTNNNVVILNSKNYGVITAGKGGNGGAGGGGAGAYGLDQNNIYNISKTYAGEKGNQTLGGIGALGFGYFSQNDKLYAGAGGGGGGAGGYAGFASANYNSTYALPGTSGRRGTNGSQNTTGVGGLAGQGYSAGTSGSNAVNITFNSTQEKQYVDDIKTGGNGGNGGLGEATTATINSTSYNANKNSFENFDFASDNTWVMGNNRPFLRFENQERYVSVQVIVYYNGENVTNNSSQYISLTNANNANTSVLTNGVWSTSNPVQNNGGSLWASSNSEFTLTNNKNYAYTISSTNLNVELSAEMFTNENFETTFSIDENNFRSNENNFAIVEVNMYDKLVGQGTLQEPYLINSFESFKTIKYYDNAGVYFMQTQNITESQLDTYILETFKGTYFGNGYNITKNNLVTTSYFKYNAGYIYDITFNIASNVVINNTNLKGFVAEENVYNAVIGNIKFIGNSVSLTTTSNVFGLIVGYNHAVISGVVVNSNVVVQLTNASHEEYFVGMVAGYNYKDINQVAVKGDLTVNSTMTGQDRSKNLYVGGVVGYNALGAEITDAYVLSSVVSTTNMLFTDYAAGIAGMSAGNIAFVYSNANVLNSLHNYKISSSYSNSAIANVTINTQKESFVNWTFNKWLFGSSINAGLPALKIESKQDINVDLNSLGQSYNGITKLQNAASIEIGSAEQLATILNYITDFASASVVKTINITSDINLNGKTLPFVTIPSLVTINGNGHSIVGGVNGYSFENGVAYVGLIKENYGKIQNIKLIENFINVNEKLHPSIKQANTLNAGIVAKNHGEIINATFYGDIEISVNFSGLTINAGVITGYNNGAKIDAVAVGGLVKVNNTLSIVNMGGVVGYATSGTIISQTNSVAVVRFVTKENANHVLRLGGIVGYALKNSAVTYATFGGIISANYTNANSRVAYVVGLMLSEIGHVSQIKQVFVNAFNTTKHNFINVQGNVVLNKLVSLNANTFALEGLDLVSDNFMLLSSTYSGWDFANVWVQTYNNVPNLYVLNDNYRKVEYSLSQNVNGYVNAYTSSGITTKLLNGSGYVWVQVESEVYELQDIAGSIKFESTDYYRYRIVAKVNDSLVLNYDDELAPKYSFGYVLSSSTAKSEITKIEITQETTNLKITIAKPQLVGVGQVVLTVTTNGVSKVIDITFNNNEFTYNGLEYGDIVTVTYNDNGVNKTLSTINQTYDKYMSTFMRNGESVATTHSNESAYITFEVNQSNSSLLNQNNALYELNFVQMNSLSLSFEHSDMVKLNIEQSDLLFSVNNIDYFSAAYVLPQVVVKVYAPQFTYRQSTSSEELKAASISYEGQRLAFVGSAHNYSVFEMTANDAELIANYVLANVEIFFNIFEEGNSLDKAKYNGVIINGVLYNNINNTAKVQSGWVTFVIINGNPGVEYNGISTPYGHYIFNNGYSALPAHAVVNGTALNGKVFKNYGNDYVVINNVNYVTVSINLESADFEYGYYMSFYFSRFDLNYVTESELSGQGSPSQPYLISTINDYATLYKAFSQNDIQYNKYKYEKYFRLENNIYNNLYMEFYGNVVRFFNPIGLINAGFDGHFDGNGNKIFDLVVIGENDNHSLGMFSYINFGSVTNLTLVDPVVIYYNSNTQLYSYGVGGIAGQASGAVITNVGLTYKNNLDAQVAVYRTGTSLKDYYVGALIGIAYNQAYVTNSYNQVSVLSDYVAGGLVGRLDGGHVKGSYNTGSVTGVISAGLVGYAQRYAYIYGSYNAGLVTSNSTTRVIASGIVNTYYEEFNVDPINNTVFDSYYVANGVEYGIQSARFLNNGQAFLTYNKIEMSDAYNKQSYKDIFVNSAQYGNFTIINENVETFNNLTQHNFGYPLLVTGQTVSLNVVTKLNGNQVDLNQLDNNNNGLVDWIILNGNSNIIPYGLPYTFVALYNDTTSKVIINSIKYVVNGQTFELNGTEVGSVFSIINHTTGNIELTVDFTIIAIETTYLPSEMFANTSVANGTIFGGVANNFVIATNYKNAIVSKVYVNNGTQNVLVNQNAISNNVQALTINVNGDDITIEVFVNQNNFVTIAVTSFGQNVSLTIVAELAVELTVANASETNQVKIIKNINGGSEVVFTTSENGTHMLTLPFGQGTLSDFVYATYTISVSRLEYDNILETMYVYEQKMFDYNEHYATLTADIELLVNPMGVVGGQNVLSNENFEVEIGLTFAELKVFYDIELNTELTANSAVTFNVITTNAVGAQNGLLDNDKNAKVYFEYNLKPTLSLDGITIVYGYDQLLEINGKTYRLVWVMSTGVNALETLVAQNRYDLLVAGLEYTFESNVKQNGKMTLYVIELFSVGYDSMLHATSWATSLSTDEEHRPLVVINQIYGLTYGGNALPSAFVSAQDTTYIDFGTSITFAGSSNHLSLDIDKERYAFKNWQDNNDQTNEQEFVLQNINSNQTVVGYYTIKTVKVVSFNSERGYKLQYSENIPAANVYIVSNGNVLSYTNSLGQEVSSAEFFSQDYEDKVMYRYDSHTEYYNQSFVMFNGTYAPIMARGVIVRPAYHFDSLVRFVDVWEVPYGEQLIFEGPDTSSYKNQTLKGFIDYDVNYSYNPNVLNSQGDILRQQNATIQNTAFGTVQTDQNGYYYNNDNNIIGMYGQVTSNVYVITDYYANITMELSSAVTRTSSYNNTGVYGNHNSRYTLEVTKVNGEQETITNIKNLNEYPIVRPVVTEGSTITLKYFVGDQTLNGVNYNLQNVAFKNWKLNFAYVANGVRHMTSIIYFNQSMTIGGVTYVVGVETETTEHGEVVNYYTLSFTMTTHEDYKYAFFVVGIEFEEPSKIIEVNTQGYGFVFVDTKEYVTDTTTKFVTKGGNGLTNKQFLAGDIGKYFIEVYIADGYTVSFEAGNGQQLENNFEYRVVNDEVGIYVFIIDKLLFEQNSDNIAVINIVGTEI